MNELFVDYIIFAKKERMESLKQRRTIRKYQQKDISADLLNDLLETSFRASTVGNMQVYSVIVTRDADKKGDGQVGNLCTGNIWTMKLGKGCAIHMQNC